jgi:hypothetical protein
MEIGMFVMHRNPDVKEKYLGDGVIAGFGTIDGRLLQYLPTTLR